MQKVPFSEKSTVEEIKEKFDRLAEDYSNLDKGQSTAIDSPLCMELITQAASSINPDATHVLDIGCGGGNYMVKLLKKLNNPDVTLIDLSENMLNRAELRCKAETKGSIKKIQGDIRNIELPRDEFDIITAATVLHRLRYTDEWEAVFASIYDALKPGGSFWINDAIVHEHPAIDALMYKGWKKKMIETGGIEFREKNMAHYHKEDTPRTLEYQLELMKKVGFHKTYILHKHFTFAAFGGIKKKK